MSKPGTHLRGVASRIFAAATMDYVIDPALADLQLECLEVQVGRSPRRTLVYLRAYISFWSAVVAHLWNSFIHGSADATPGDGYAIRRVLINSAAVVIVVTAVVVLPVSLTAFESVRLAVGGDIALALALLIPMATPISLPAGLLFGTLWSVRHLRPTSVRRTILVVGLVASIFSAAMLEWVIPRTNQAYRVLVFQNERHVPPEKGPRELTWRELREQLALRSRLQGTPQTRQLRLAYQLHFALTAQPLIFAMLAAVLVTRQRRFTSWLLGFLLYVAYYTLVAFDPLIDRGTLSPVAVAWTPNLVVLTVTLLLRSGQRVSSLFGQA